MADEVCDVRAYWLGCAVALDVRTTHGRLCRVVPSRFSMWAVRELADDCAAYLGVDMGEANRAIASAYMGVAA